MESVVRVVGLMKGRVNFVKELWPLCSFFFRRAHNLRRKDRQKALEGLQCTTMSELAALLEGLSDFSMAAQEEAVNAWLAENDYKMGDVMNAWRLTLVGEGKGPHMYEISSFLGQAETLKRMRRAIEILG